MITDRTVWVVHVPERFDGVYVFATEAAASMFGLAVGYDNCVTTEEPVNNDATPLVEAERDV